jgi:hypothetical protein
MTRDYVKDLVYLCDEEVIKFLIIGWKKYFRLQMAFKCYFKYIGNLSRFETWFMEWSIQYSNVF